MEISSLKRDVGPINAGEWVADIPRMGTLRLKVRGMGSDAYARALSKRMQALPMSDRERDGSATPDARKRVVAESLHEAVLLDWDGLTNGGKAFPYDSDAAYLWMTDPGFVQFIDAVLWAATVVDNGRAKVEGDLAKN